MEKKRAILKGLQQRHYSQIETMTETKSKEKKTFANQSERKGEDDSYRTNSTAVFCYRGNKHRGKRNLLALIGSDIGITPREVCVSA